MINFKKLKANIKASGVFGVYCGFLKIKFKPMIKDDDIWLYGPDGHTHYPAFWYLFNYNKQ